jgi:hypothetical protein
MHKTNSRSRLLCVIAILVWSLFGFAHFSDAASYSDPSGFSFTCPEGWSVVADPGNQTDSSAVPAAAREWIQKNGASLSSAKAVVLKDGANGFTPNLNVIVQQQEMPMRQSSVDKLLNILPGQYSSRGITIEQMEGKLTQYAGRDAGFIQYISHFRQIPWPLRQRQVFFVGGGNTYILTFTSRADEFTANEPALDSILNSFNAPAAMAQGFNWGKVWSSAGSGAVIGGVAGAIGGLVLLLRKKRKA